MKGIGFLYAKTSKTRCTRALHHVNGRGINGVKIFDSRKDREDFIERLAGLCGADAINDYDWAFLSNHFHRGRWGARFFRMNVYWAAATL